MVTKARSYSKLQTATTFLLLIILFSGMISCKKDGNVLVSDVYDFKSDSLRIVQAFSEPLDIKQLDSISRVLTEEIGAKNKSYYLYALHYGRALILKGNLHKADSLITEVLQDTRLGSGSLEAARLYNLKAAIYTYRQNQRLAVEYYKMALEVFENHNDLRSAATIEYNLSNFFLSQLDHETSYKYVKSAIEKLNTVNDTVYLPQVLGLTTVSALKSNHEDEAVLFVEKATELSEKYNNFTGKLLSLYAQGELQMHQKNFDKAEEYLTQVVKMGEQYNLKSMLLPAKAALLRTYFEKGEYKEAIDNGEEAKALAKQLGNTEIQYSLYKNLAYSYQQIGKSNQAFEYLSNAEEHLREKSSRENRETIQDLLIQYETEKKNNQILKQKNKLAVRKVYVSAFAIISIILLVFLLLYRQNTQHKYKMLAKEKEHDVLNALNMGEEKERKRLARELHDGLGGLLAASKMQLSVLESDMPEEFRSQSQKINDIIGKAITENRRISHNLLPENLLRFGLKAALEDFVQYINDGKKQVVDLETLNLDERLPEQLELIVYRIVQELLNNITKHSEATKAFVQLHRMSDMLAITVEDNGKGFEISETEKGIGLVNIESRLQYLNGKMMIDSKKKTGTSIYIEITI